MSPQFFVLVLQECELIPHASVIEVFAIVSGLQFVYTFLKFHDLCIFVGKLIKITLLILDNEFVIWVHVSLFPQSLILLTELVYLLVSF